MQRRNATNERYWAEYDGLQHAKHQLLRRYLDGWFPIMSTRNARILYVDCHAGRGRHKTGHEGSPILALRRLLGHTHRDRILAHTEVCFVFLERDLANYRYLTTEIASLGKLPDNVRVHPFCGDYEAELRRIVDYIRRRGTALAPAFAFLDPYGFTLSMDLLNELLAFRKCELLVNFMYLYVDWAMSKLPMARTLDALFGCRHWRQLATTSNREERADKTIALFARQLQARWVTHMYMRAANGTLKYVLLHATNHRRGRELIKEAMWSVTPDGSFSAFERDSPDQLVLIVPDPDLEPLRRALWAQFAGRRVRITELYDWLLGALYLHKHLHQVLREYRKRKVVSFTAYSGRFSFKQDPLVRFPSERPRGD